MRILCHFFKFLIFYTLLNEREPFYSSGSFSITIMLTIFHKQLSKEPVFYKEVQLRLCEDSN